MADRVRLAAVTMVYNEARLLPVWLGHYARQVGAKNCYVVDHGSDDGSTADLGPVTVIRLPRSPHDDTRRARFLSQFCNGLLEWFDGVIHTDVDEIVLPDPARHADLLAFAAGSTDGVSTAVGLNVVHMADEAPFDPAEDLFAQRRYAAFSSALCKPVLIRRPVAWAPGFHCADAPICFDGLFLFHLRYVDRDWALERLQRTRAMPRVADGGGAHQRVGDDEFREMLGNFTRLARRDGVILSIDAPPVAAWLKAVLDSRAGRENDTYTIDLHLNSYEIWPLTGFRCNPHADPQALLKP